MTDEREQVGSVAEEAAKLFEALQSRTDRGPDGYPGPGGGMLAGLGAILGDLGGGEPTDSATHGDECRSCPVCRGIAIFRGIRSNPEVKHHLAMAADSLLQAVTEAMETRVPGASDEEDQQAREQATPDPVDEDDEATG